MAQRGQLNAPWGLAMAPASFGRFAGDLLVGNFGDGQINAYVNGNGGWHPTARCARSDGGKLVIDGLWALEFGNAGTNGDPNTLFFTAGPDHESNGLFGTITPGEVPLPTAPAEAAFAASAGARAGLSVPLGPGVSGARKVTEAALPVDTKVSPSSLSTIPSCPITPPGYRAGAACRASSSPSLRPLLEDWPSRYSLRIREQFRDLATEVNDVAHQPTRTRRVAEVVVRAKQPRVGEQPGKGLLREVSASSHEPHRAHAARQGRPR